MKSKADTNLVLDHELYEKSRKRIKQKKRLYNHFILFALSVVLFYVLNKVLRVGEYLVDSWYLYVAVVWFFIWLLHFINVFITHKFFGEDWEREQTEKLILKHQKRVDKLEKKLIKKGVLNPIDTEKKRGENNQETQ